MKPEIKFKSQDHKPLTLYLLDQMAKDGAHRYIHSQAVMEKKINNELHHQYLDKALDSLIANKESK